MMVTKWYEKPTFFFKKGVHTPCQDDDRLHVTRLIFLIHIRD